MRLISDGLFFPCLTLLDYSTVGWTLQRRRRHIQRSRHKGQFAPGLFRVVCMFNPLILFVCMWMQFALRMGCFLTGCFSQTTSDVLSTIPLLDGHYSAAAVASNAPPDPTLLPQLTGPFPRSSSALHL